MATNGVFFYLSRSELCILLTILATKIVYFFIHFSGTGYLFHFFYYQHEKASPL